MSVFIPELQPVGHICDDDAGELDGADEAHPDDARLTPQRLAVLAPTVHQVDCRQVLHGQRVAYVSIFGSNSQIQELRNYDSRFLVGGKKT